ncbi:MAG: DNA mismatch repair protein MutS, partial [Chloroflexota bacterium]|nr:DNA mismatch repair protein MutS [Chloroflexota bacterium]
MTTPIRRQYLRVKQQYPDAIVLFRLGDFYETFDEDAKLAARELDIVLTSRSMGKSARVPMAGIPAQALESYLARLIKRGHKVAICEQLTDPAASKGLAPGPSRGLMERDVVRVVTPGTVIEPALLEQKANNYLAAVALGDGQAPGPSRGLAGLAYIDITTGEFATGQLAIERLGPELARLSPAEVLVEEGVSLPPGSGSPTVTPLAGQSFRLDRAREALLAHFAVATLEPFGCEGLPLAVRAAGAIVAYLVETQKAALGHLTGLTTYSPHAYMTLDPQTVRN